MNRPKSVLIFLISTAAVIATAGCYTNDKTYRISEPAGSPGGYYRDGRYYSPSDQRNHQWDYYERNDERHQWDNYQRNWR